MSYANLDWQAELRRLREPTTENPSAPVIAPAPVAVESAPPTPTIEAESADVPETAQTGDREEWRPNRKYKNAAEKQQAYLARQKQQEQIDALAETAAKLVSEELQRQQSSKQTEIDAPTPSEIILPAGPDLSGLRERGADVAPAPQPVIAAPQPVATVEVSQPTIVDVEDYLTEEPEPTCAADLCDEKYIAAKAKWRAQCDKADAEQTRILKNADKERRRLEAEAELIELMRIPEPLPLTPMEKLRVELESKPFSAEQVASFTDPDAERPWDALTENRTDLPPRSSQRISWLISHVEKTEADRNRRIENDLARIAHRGR